jgi:hypothetical protein
MPYPASAVTEQLCAVLNELLTESSSAVQVMLDHRVTLTPGGTMLPGVSLETDGRFGVINLINAALHRIAAPTLRIQTHPQDGTILGFYVCERDGTPAVHQPATIHDILHLAAALTSYYTQADATTTGGHPSLPQGGNVAAEGPQG